MPEPEQQDLISRQHWLIHAKLGAPRQQVRLIERPHLMTRLDQFLARRLGLVVAPAGFGKTTLLSQWRQRLIDGGTKVAWLTLDEGDADVHQFLSYIVFALAESGVSVGRLESLAEQGLMDMSQRVALSAILETIVRETGRTVLILDDYHRLQSSEINALISNLVASSPPNFCLVMNSRLRPAINLPQLLATGQALELVAKPLRFSREEIRHAVAIPVSDDVLETLFERTEGWAVAVQLARLLVQGEGGRSEFLTQFTGRSGHIASYLADQILATLPDDIQDFLMQTSVVERFNAPLANALCKRHDSREILRKLENLQALLVPVDDQQEWFRYHPLFADYLQDLLRRKHPRMKTGLHKIASEWFEGAGRVSEAVRQARLAGDFDRCAHLIECAGGWQLILYGGIGYLRNLMRHIPAKELPRFPRLQLAQAYLYVKDGQLRKARALCDAAAAVPVGGANDAALDRDLFNIRAMLETYEDMRVTPDSLRELFERHRTVAPEDAMTKGIVGCLLALATLAVGQFSDTDQISRTAMRAMRQAGSMPGLNYCYLHAGAAAFYRGQCQLAEAHFWEAQRMAEDNFGADSGLKFMSDVLFGALQFWRGDLSDAARHNFRKAMDHVEQFDGWFEIYAFGLDADVEIALSCNDPDRAREAIARAHRIVEQKGIRRLHDLARAHQLKLGARFPQAAPLASDGDAEQIFQLYPIGCWKDDPFCWRPYMELALAGYGRKESLPNHLALLNDAIACCRAFDARFHLIRLLTERAIINDRMNRREAALEGIFEALKLAAPERIRQPFRDRREVSPLLRAVQKKLRQEGAGGLILNFLSDCLALGGEGGRKGFAASMPMS